MSSSSELEILYFKFGNIPYAIGEDVSQLEHGLQAAESAQRIGYDRDFVLACLLHDIGHLIGARDGLESMDGGGPNRKSDSVGVRHHESVGADWLLQHGFSEYTADLVRNHTNAKRYLATVSLDYLQQLSEASLCSLLCQGGVMSPDEKAAFENCKRFQDFIRLRRFDDSAKKPAENDEARQRARWQRFFPVPAT